MKNLYFHKSKSFIAFFLPCMKGVIVEALKTKFLLQEVEIQENEKI